jgi:hypothetical protein
MPGAGRRRPAPGSRKRCFLEDALAHRGTAGAHLVAGDQTGRTRRAGVAALRRDRHPAVGKLEVAPALVDRVGVDVRRRRGEEARAQAVRVDGVAEVHRALGRPADLVEARVRREHLLRGTDRRHGRLRIGRDVDPELRVVGLLGSADRGEVGLALARLRLQLEAKEVRNRDRRENSDDGDDDHQLDEREAALACVKLLHGISLNCDLARDPREIPFPDPFPGATPTFGAGGSTRSLPYAGRTQQAPCQRTGGWLFHRQRRHPT